MIFESKDLKKVKELSKYLLVFVLLFNCSLYTATVEWVSLFDGKSLSGWEALPGGQWSVKDGYILGFQEKAEKRHGMLLSKQTYSDFIVKLKYRANKGNSGFYFRVNKVDHKVSVKGFQAEVDSRGNGQGGLYETLGRAWVIKPKKEFVDSFYKLGEWNEMTVRAVGRHVVVKVNGVKTAELKNDPGNLEGHFGLQLHGGQDMDVQYKDIMIQDLSQRHDVGISHSGETIHDKSLPLPPNKNGLDEKTLSMSSQAPDNAIVLFNGKDLKQWKNKNWMLSNSTMQTVKGKGYQESIHGYGDGRYHVEWRIVDPESHGNSGVFIHGLYEVQIFNSYKDHSPIYPDGQAAAIYGQYPPAFNVCKKAGQWEFFDIDFIGPRYHPDGSIKSKAKITVYHNGIRVHHLAELTGPTAHKKRPDYKKTPESLPLKLQDHGDKVQFRNIWYLPEPQ